MHTISSSGIQLKTINNLNLYIMNTETIIEIIAMIDSRLMIIEETFICDPDREEYIDVAQQVGKEKALEELRAELQKYL